MVETMQSEADLDRLLSGDRPAWIFKHSSTCPISAEARSAFEKHIRDHPDDAAGLLVVQEARDLSSRVASRFGIPHQSPQLLYVRGDEVLWHASHSAVTSEAMEDARTRVAG